MCILGVQIDFLLLYQVQNLFIKLERLINKVASIIFDNLKLFIQPSIVETRLLGVDKIINA